MNSTTVRLPKVNDVLHSSWGYDQTNATFYLVTKVTGARVTLQTLRNIETPKGPMFGSAVPDLKAFTGAPMVKGFKATEKDYYVKVASYAGAFLWDGKPAEVSHTH